MNEVSLLFNSFIFLGSINTLNAIITLKEESLEQIINSLVQANEDKSLFSYEVSCCFIRGLLTNYVLYCFEKHMALLSRRILSLIETVCHNFPRQFIYSSLLVWLSTISISNAKTTLNDEYNDFIFQIIKNMSEAEAIMTMDALLNRTGTSERYFCDDNLYE